MLAGKGLRKKKKKEGRKEERENEIRKKE